MLPDDGPVGGTETCRSNFKINFNMCRRFFLKCKRFFKTIHWLQIVGFIICTYRKEVASQTLSADGR